MLADPLQVCREEPAKRAPDNRVAWDIVELALVVGFFFELWVC